MCSEGIHESIDERQNSTESLDKLAAQRLLYRKVNKVELARLGLLFSVVVVLFAGLAFGPATMGEHVGLGGALAVVLFWIVDSALSGSFGATDQRRGSDHSTGL